MPGLEPRLSGRVFLDKAHGIDSFWSESFSDGFGHEKETTPCGTGKPDRTAVALSRAMTATVVDDKTS